MLAFEVKKFTGIVGEISGNEMPAIILDDEFYLVSHESPAEKVYRVVHMTPTGADAYRVTDPKRLAKISQEFRRQMIQRSAGLDDFGVM